MSYLGFLAGPDGWHLRPKTYGDCGAVDIVLVLCGLRALRLALGLGVGLTNGILWLFGEFGLLLAVAGSAGRVAAVVAAAVAVVVVAVVGLGRHGEGW